MELNAVVKNDGSVISSKSPPKARGYSCTETPKTSNEETQDILLALPFKPIIYLIHEK